MAKMEIETKKQEKAAIDAYYSALWDDASSGAFPQATEDRIWNAVRSSIKGRKHNIFPYTVLLYAAAVVAGVIITVCANYILSKQQLTETKEFIVSTDNGEHSDMTLPDGTKVSLNSHSTLSFTADYGKKERNVTLHGEAFFDVAKDENSRFIVSAGEMTLEAIGTEFNVKAYDDDKEIVTTLLEGKIKAKIGNSEVMLLPEQFIAFNRETRKCIHDRSENAEYSVMWRSGEFAVKSKTMGEIGAILNRMYNIEVRFESEKVRNHTFTGVIRNNSLKNIFEIINLTEPIDYQFRGDTVILKEKKRVKSIIMSNQSIKK